MVAEVCSKPAASAMKKPFGLRSRMGKWCCHCFSCCRGSGKSNVGTWADYDDSAFEEPRYQVRREDLDQLHRAAWWGKVPRADLIVMLRSTDVNETDTEQRTALHLASANGNSEIVKLLLYRRCELHAFDSKKRTALIKAVQCQEDECVLTLLEHGTDPDLPDVYGNTALHYAVYNEDKLLAKALLLYGADIEAKNKCGLTPLSLAVYGQKEKMMKFLIKKKANVNAIDKFGRTVLILAVCCGSASMVGLLLDQDIDAFCQDKSGKTARDYAVSSQHNIICQLLSDYKEKQKSKKFSENSNPVRPLCCRTTGDPLQISLTSGSPAGAAEQPGLLLLSPSTVLIPEGIIPADTLRSQKLQQPVGLEHQSPGRPGMRTTCRGLFPRRRQSGFLGLCILPGTSGTRLDLTRYWSDVTLPRDWRAALPEAYFITAFSQEIPWHSTPLPPHFHILSPPLPILREFTTFLDPLESHVDKTNGALPFPAGAGRAVTAGETGLTALTPTYWCPAGSGKLKQALSEASLEREGL
ncbi:putative POTE ankyrin domain family member M [Saimiri boliviensis]|uniref:putative POTE ankyrin domain family member M n=1 Tax=Saimiri boliviensis TaxID=27679 RepID=UPI003D7897A1